MSRAYDFLKECGYFFVLTINGDFPAGRPFGAVMEYDGKLFILISTKAKGLRYYELVERLQGALKKEGGCSGYKAVK